MRSCVMLAALAAGLVQAQYRLINELSFGTSSTVSNDDSPGSIPHFTVTGQPNRPNVLSNKVILTPMGIGNHRASIWADKNLLHLNWVAEVDFRANGPERASGNINIWLARDGSSVVGESSVYTVGRFEGLVLIIDQYGGSGGMLRGFLNDGSQDYSQQTNIDALAFGHCHIAYRNLGRPTQVKVQQTKGNFKVEVDGHLCFQSDKIAIPQGYKLGITAATPESPDSFEVFKLDVKSESSDVQQEQERRQQQQQQQQGGQQHQQQDDPEEVFKKVLADENADSFATSRAQFTDLHNRLQSTYHQLTAVYRAVTAQHVVDEQRHKEMQEMVQNIRADTRRLDKVDALQRTVAGLEREVGRLREQLDRRISSHESSFRGALTDHHHQLSERIASSIPGHGKLIFVFVGTQLLLAFVYIVYKRRRMATAKKFL